MKKDHNLNNPTANPENAAINCSVMVHFDMHSAVPKDNLQRWLSSLPPQARVTFAGISNGKTRFEAAWVEQRPAWDSREVVRSVPDEPNDADGPE